MVSYFAAFFSIGLVLASLGPILPVLAVRVGLTSETLGILFVFRSAGYMVGSLIGGFIFDCARRTHLPLACGNILCGLGCALIPSLRSVATLGAAIATQGGCMGLLDTGGNVLLIWLQGSERVEPYMQTMHFCFALGAVLSPLLIDWTIRLAESDDGFAAAFYIMACLLLLSSIPLIPTNGPTSPPTASSSASASDPDQATASGRRSTSSMAHALAARCGLSPLEASLVLCSAICLMVYVGSEVGYGGFVFTFATTHLGMADASARALNSVYWGGLALGRLAAIPAAARFRPDTILNVSLVGTTLAAAALLWLAPPADEPLTFGGTSSGRSGNNGSIFSGSGGGGSGSGSALAWLATAALGWCHAPIFPTVLTHTERHMRVSGRIASTFVLCAATGEALLPVVITLAYVASQDSFPQILLVASIAQLAAYGGARAAAGGLEASKRRAADSATEARTAADGVAMSNAVTTVA